MLLVCKPVRKSSQRLFFPFRVSSTKVRLSCLLQTLKDQVDLEVTSIVLLTGMSRQSCLEELVDEVGARFALAFAFRVDCTCPCQQKN